MPASALCTMMEDIHSLNPPTKLVSSFVSLLDISDNDYNEEYEHHKVLTEVLQTIRYNRDLEHQVNRMDLKISLIVRNHLTTLNLQSRKISLTRAISVKPQDMEETTNSYANVGIFGHNKECHLLLNAYQYVFYLLQTDPRYMARLIIATTPGFSMKFIESLVCNLYNWGSTPREECLMVQFFGLALTEEVRTRVDKLSDIGTSGSAVLKMILTFYKKGSGLSSLKNLLQPVVEDILNDKSLYLSTDPTEIYKYWINELETNRGQVVQMPYDLPAEQAEKVPEVIERIQKSIQSLKSKVGIFVNHIVESGHLLPYGICYVAKILCQCLTNKFPEASQVEIMKCVGHLLYYRYIIATIPAADTFGVITLQPGVFLNTIQRRNLGTIAKVLQHAAAFQLFELSNRLNTLNEFLLTCHQKFFDFLKLVCAVEEPEVCFNMDSYSEATLLRKPEITLPLKDIILCHELLRTHREEVASDPQDPLHELLNELGEPVAVEPHMSNEMITLLLTCKYPVQSGVPALEELMKNTEQLVVQFLQCQSNGESLLEMLRSDSTQDQESRFHQLKNGQCKSTCEMLSQFENISVFKKNILHKLVQLELGGYVSSCDEYQAMINLIAKRIINRNSYRDQRKMEIGKLYGTLTQLKLKTKYYKDTLEYYSEYIRNCLQSMEGKQKGVKRKVLKYSGARFAEIGILLGISGFDKWQLKHVTFEISTTGLFGVFSVSVKLHSSCVERFDMDFQHLLELQYEGETIVEMFGGAKININLLLHFLNRKFFSS